MNGRIAKDKGYGIRPWTPDRRRVFCPACGKQTVQAEERAQDSDTYGVYGTTCPSCRSVVAVSVLYMDEREARRERA